MEAPAQVLVTAISQTFQNMNSYLTHSNSVVSSKCGEVKVVRIKRCLASFLKEAFELVARPEPFVRGSNDEHLVAAGGGATLPLGDFAVPSVGERVVLKQWSPVWIDHRPAARWNPAWELLLVNGLGGRGGIGVVGEGGGGEGIGGVRVC